MTLRAKRLGLIFTADDGPDWMNSHAAYPSPLRLSKNRLRIYLVARDAQNRGTAGYIDVAASEPTQILDVSEKPCLMPGALGSFDDRGISIGSVFWHEDEIWMYYMGWNKAADVPFRNAIGLAICKDKQGAHFSKAYEGPLLDRSRHDPYTLSYPYVTPPTDAGLDWTMYYGTSRAGGDKEDNMLHVLTQARSNNGIDWQPSGQDIVSLAPGEFGLSRPYLCSAFGKRYLFYSIRRASYSIGLSVYDPKKRAFARVTADFLGPGTASWENKASCYPSIAPVGDKIFMFYNGNDYGRTGLGVAELS